MEISQVSLKYGGAVRKIPVKDLPPVRYYLVTRPDREDRVDELRRALT